jgi:hypothetical protein
VKFGVFLFPDPSLARKNCPINRAEVVHLVRLFAVGAHRFVWGLSVSEPTVTSPREVGPVLAPILSRGLAGSSHLFINFGQKQVIRFYGRNLFRREWCAFLNIECNTIFSSRSCTDDLKSDVKSPQTFGGSKMLLVSTMQMFAGRRDPCLQWNTVSTP